MASEIRVDTVYNESGDSDSGLDMSTNDVVAVKIAGSEKLRVHSDGKLGVGTASPSYNVHSVTTSGSDYAGFFHNSAGSGNGTALVVKGGANNTGAGTFIVQDYGGNTDLMVDGNGHVTMPNQSAFNAKNDGTQSNIATSSQVAVALGTERFDVNADFASNTFTAPVTGKYQLNVIMRLDNLDSAADYYELKLVTSNNNYGILFDPDFGQDNSYWDMTISVLTDMDASDTATVQIRQQSGTAQADIVSITFSGFLAC